MSLRFFCDQCVPAEISDTLRATGNDVTLLREALPIRSPDSAVNVFLAGNPTQECFHGKLLIVEAHRIRIRQ